MGRWEPDAAKRLREAAMELYLERGYEQTTVADIAQRAGLTARTFFRYFADKREVLFNGSSELQGQMLAALQGTPTDACPLDAIAAALAAGADVLGERHAYARKRHAVIAANAELRERELIKMAALSEALASGLRERGLSASEASLAAEAGVAVFRVGFQRWVDDRKDRGLAAVLQDSLAQLQAVTAR